MKTQEIIISPKIAKKYLSHNNINRRTDPKIIEKYAGDMLSGNWGITHQGICFLKNGKLADGQHRLMAIVKSGVSIRMMVTRGVDKIYAVGIDQGKARTVGNAIEIGGLSDWIEPRDISILKAVFCIKWTISPTLAVEIAEEIKPTLLFIKKAFKKRKRGVTTAKVLSIVALAHLSGEKEERLAEFCDELVSGVSIREFDTAVIRLRDHLMDHVKPDSKKIHAALRAFLKYKPLKYLRSSTVSQFELPSHLMRFERNGVKNEI